MKRGKSFVEGPHGTRATQLAGGLDEDNRRNCLGPLFGSSDLTREDILAGNSFYRIPTSHV